MERARILLVDDRAENLLALEAILSSLDQTLVRANSGEEALKALLADEYAVILLDVQMPGMDGFETAAHIKRRDKTKDVPVIFLTAIHSEPHHAFRGYAAGAVDYLTKPFDPWVLRAKVSVFVDLHRKNKRLEEQAQLLHHQLVPADAHGASGVVRELSGRLAAVEEQTALLRGRLDDAKDMALLDDVATLASRVERLRAGLDAVTPERDDGPAAGAAAREDQG
ncbi:MAG: response regulator [Actinomycetes bacterium]